MADIYGLITIYVSDYINLFVRIAHIIYNQVLLYYDSLLQHLSSIRQHENLSLQNGDCLLFIDSQLQASCIYMHWHKSISTPVMFITRETGGSEEPGIVNW